MPFADLSLCFTDSEIVDSFIVSRRQDLIDQHGRNNPTVVSRYNATGIVTIAGANDLRRVPEMEIQNKVISITTPFQIQSARYGQQPDIIHWHGEDYVVIDLQDYTGFGPGFVNALAQRLDPAPSSNPLIRPPR